MSKCVNKPDKLREKIPEKTRLRLWVRSGGRCAHCNDVVYRDSFTLMNDNFSEVAHIIASSKDGPRGNELSEQLQIDYENLILLCSKCHKLVDGDNKNEFPIKKLRQIKQDHERRIEILTSINRNAKTNALIIKSSIGVNHVEVNEKDVNIAVIKNRMYPSEEQPYVIDLTNDSGRGDENFYKSKSRQLKQALNDFLGRFNSASTKQHISIFPLALMPLLVSFGRELGSKHAIQLFQYDRTENNWIWKDRTKDIEYITLKPDKPIKDKDVFLKISLSDSIGNDKLKSVQDTTSNIYEITIDNPTPHFLVHRDLITKFDVIYRQMLNEIQLFHGANCNINLLLAVPAPIAVQCGLSLLPGKDPNIWAYDYDKEYGGFIKALKIN